MFNDMLSMHTYININSGLKDNRSTQQQLNSCNLSHVLSNGAAGKLHKQMVLPTHA